jgi:hypothetical protein
VRLITTVPAGPSYFAFPGSACRFPATTDRSAKIIVVGQLVSTLRQTKCTCTPTETKREGLGTRDAGTAVGIAVVAVVGFGIGLAEARGEAEGDGDADGDADRLGVAFADTSGPGVNGLCWLSSASQKVRPQVNRKQSGLRNEIRDSHLQRRVVS